MAETTDKAVRNRGWSVAFRRRGYLTAGIVYAWSVISNGLIAEYNWTSTEASRLHNHDHRLVAAMAVLECRTSTARRSVPFFQESWSAVA